MTPGELKLRALIARHEAGIASSVGRPAVPGPSVISSRLLTHAELEAFHRRTCEERLYTYDETAAYMNEWRRLCDPRDCAAGPDGG